MATKKPQTLEEALNAAEEKNREAVVPEESTQEDNTQKRAQASNEDTTEEAQVKQVVVTPEKVQDCRMFLSKFGIAEHEYSDEEVIEKVQRIQSARASHAQILSRGRTLDGLDRLLKFVPRGYVGEFKRERPEDISRAKALGFEVLESKDAAVASSTGAADGKVRFGDCILMIIPEEEYIASHLAKQDRIISRRNSRKPEQQVGTPVGQFGEAGIEADPLVPIVPM